MNPERRARQERAMREHLAQQEAEKAEKADKDAAPAGWYPAEDGADNLRYWDGSSWTEHYAPAESPEPSAEVTSVLAEGLIHGTTFLRIYSDGTFASKGAFGGWSQPDRLVAFDFDMDSMRRKSVAGRGAAAMMTGGLSLAASNNRGVLYVTVTGQQSGVRTYTTRNPAGIVLSGTRSLKQAADTLNTSAQPTAPAGVESSVTDQLQKLADLHAAGALTASEFTAAKARLLS